jgi:hypothetical protein
MSTDFGTCAIGGYNRHVFGTQAKPMYDLLVNQVQLVHTAYFARPVLELWGEGKRILQELYEAFSPYGVTLSDIRVESATSNPADQVVAVTIGVNGIHRFRYDRIESTFFNFSDEFLAQIPPILNSSTAWIRATVPSAKFVAHHFVYSSHSNIGGISIDELLKSIGPAGPAAGGVNTGSGVIFHWEVPERQWTTQLVIDKSLALGNGVFRNSTSGLSKRDRSAPLPGQAASTRSECEAQCKLHEARRRQRRNVLAELCRVIG